MTDYLISEPKSKAFVRVPWDEVNSLLISMLRVKYGAKGNIKYKKDLGCYEGIHDAYDIPDFIDVYLDQD